MLSDEIREQRQKNIDKVFSDALISEIKESQPFYGFEKKQGEHTLQDYYALPDERRAELIDGVFYDMASLSSVHQIISGQVYRCFSDYIDENQGNCIAMYAPFDVQLDCDDKTIVQPDIMIICDRSKFRDKVVYGAPDLVVEILSKSTWKKDVYIKLEKYVRAGVREYWIIDPDKKKVVAYELEKEQWPVIYRFDDMVPVGIFDGGCVVNFANINERIHFLEK